MSPNGKRVFVTGATGFICSHILKLLVEVKLSCVGCHLLRIALANQSFHLDREDTKLLLLSDLLPKLKPSLLSTRHGEKVWNSFTLRILLLQELSWRYSSPRKQDLTTLSTLRLR